MGFLSPWFLGGLLAVGLPLWLHLLRQHKSNPKPFSSLMFFERRIQSSTKHRRLRYLALLSLRMALLILLALAFANPFINRPSANVGKRNLTVIAIDRSFSMRSGDRLQQAKRAAHDLLGSLSGNNLAQVIALDSRVENLTGPELNRGVANAAVETIQANDQTSSFGELARALRVMAQTVGMHLDVHLFSDMQQTSMPGNFRDLALGGDTALRLHAIGDASTSNWAVETITTSPNVYDVKHTRLTTTIAGWQTKATAPKVSLLLDGKTLASKNVEVPPNGRAQVEFLGFDVPYGAHHGLVRMEPADQLSQDDEFPFSVERSDPRRVLFLYAAGRTRESYYYKAALDSAPETGLLVEASPIEQASGKNFSKYAFIVLSDVGELNDKIAQELCRYVQHGGAALIALGPAASRAGRLPLSNISLREVRQTQGVSFVDAQHPAFLGAVGPLANVQFFQANSMSPKPDARILAKLADGTPLLIEDHMGEGKTLTFASTLDNSTNDFPLHTSFVPFVVQTARYLAGKEDARASVVAGTPVTLRRTRSEGTSADVIAPDGKHQLSLAESTSAFSFDLDRQGFYEVQPANGPRQLVAVHTDRRESDLTKIPNDTLELWSHTGDGVATPNAATVQSQTRPWSLWRYVLLLALAAALIESFFASGYLREAKQTE